MTGFEKLKHIEGPLCPRRRSVLIGIAGLMPFSCLGTLNQIEFIETSLLSELNYIDNVSTAKNVEPDLTDTARWLSALCNEASYEGLQDILYGRIMSDYTEDRLVLRGNKFVSLTENYLYEVLRLKHGS